MRWVTITEYVNDPDKQTAIRPEHGAYLRGLREAGKLHQAGGFTDGTGGLYIYEAESKEDAEELITNDPYCKNGIFQSWNLRPWGNAPAPQPPPAS